MCSKRGLSREEIDVLLELSSDSGLDGGRHFPKKSEQKYASRCRSLACRSKTRYLCGRCNVPLCRECFQSFHGT
ncbi:hypothetical protein MRX96_025643 [Rhipicephalus microplus]